MSPHILLDVPLTFVIVIWWVVRKGRKQEMST